MALRLYFLRHGQTAHSRNNDFCGSGIDAELTPEGAQMAQAFAEHYRATPWKAVLVSPLTRTRMSAEPLLALTGLTPDIRPELREIAYGKWEGKTLEEVTSADGDAYRSWVEDPTRIAPPGGETALEIKERVLRLINELQATHSEGNILLISHKATIRIAVCALLQLELKRYRQLLDCPVSSLSLVELRPTGPMLRFYASQAHLPEPLLNLPGT